MMARTCPPCDQGCAQGRDCPARVLDAYIAEREAEQAQRAADTARTAQRLAERLFPAPTPQRLWPEERMLLIIGAATVVALLMGWL